MACCSSSVRGPLWAGTEYVAVRWNTITWPACSAMTGIDWTPEEPVPMTPTRFPVKSTGSCGQRPVWNVGPAKLSAPGKSGMLADERQPVAMMRYRADISHRRPF